MSFEQHPPPRPPVSHQPTSQYYDQNLHPSAAQYRPPTSQPQPIPGQSQSQPIPYSTSLHGSSPYGVSPSQGNSFQTGTSPGPSPAFAPQDPLQRARVGSHSSSHRPGSGFSRHSHQHSYHSHSPGHSHHSRPSYSDERRSSHRHHEHHHNHESSKKNANERPTLGDTILMMWDTLTGSKRRRE
ncbi:hypothetical protein P152DRAFT_446279 [Eremomyces bilateralis CBS 781.70]|uniref:Uncharacterized protein n=1 Tax=Eremomyces bilateralis CBS 781.70 TaxID=1392243 RepID=A0A6G1GF49_9PEZI|nr:uncharacterized protein P152DRAFT_446279 [Eremomyces bilateralis CBS 781.70]KAF1816654.1 hypothetical protein P152DRAFT_446279 [Eremomyces bilateralis CBS 781.70]